VFFSSYIDSGAICEYRRLSSANVRKMPRAIASRSPPPVRTRSPFLPFTIAVPVSWHDGSTPPAAALSVTVAQPGTPLFYFNNVGIGNDSDPTRADFDGDGFSLSEQALAAGGAPPGGHVPVGGFSFAWPTDPVDEPDNIMVGGGGQTLDLSGTPASATRLSVLGTGTNGNVTGTLTITYTDGSTQAATIGFGDWTLGAGGEGLQYGNLVAVRMPYRNGSGGPDQVTTYVFATAPIMLTAGRTVASVTLPSALNGGDMHVFAVATG